MGVPRSVHHSATMRLNAVFTYEIICFALCTSDILANSDGVARRRDGNIQRSMRGKPSTKTVAFATLSKISDGFHPASAPTSSGSLVSPSIFPFVDLARSSSGSLSAAGHDIVNLAVSTSPNGNAQATTKHLSTRSNTISDDKLPLSPSITPALSIAGLILIVAGTSYTLIGIKNTWIQIFLSAAFLASVSVTVLLTYVMHPPIRDVVQGAYLVAIFMAGMIFGAVSLAFTEVTEGLGCLLGGFCFSMWLLVLRPGSTLQSTGAKVILITAFTLATFSLSFNRRTRLYGTIGCTSFAGATALVLGIDCFSRAGLKEFWLYVWNLNDNIFPLGTDTYPITRGIRVETAFIVIIFVFGLLSQSRIWKVVQEQRKKKDAIRLDSDIRREHMEMAIARRLEDGHVRERDEWERRFRDRGSNKRHTDPNTALSTEDTLREPSIRVKEITEENVSFENIELRDLQVCKANSRPASFEGAQIINTAAPPPEQALDVFEAARSDHPPSNGSRLVKKATGLSRASSRASEFPQMAPLSHLTTSIAESRQSTEALSTVTSTAPEPGMPNTSQTRYGQCVSLDIPKIWRADAVSQMGEPLLVPDTPLSCASSVAATVDDNVEELNLRLLPFTPAADPETADGIMPGRDDLFSTIPLTGHVGNEPGAIAPTPPALSIGEHDPEEFCRPHPADQAQSDKDFDGEAPVGEPPTCERKESAAESNNELLTKSALEQVTSELSHVALYRTNEWAKRISNADNPVHDEPRETAEGSSGEVAAPVQIEELQRSTISEPAKSVRPEVQSPSFANIGKTASLLKSLNKSESSPALVASKQGAWAGLQTNSHYPLAPHPRNFTTSVLDLSRSSTRLSQPLQTANGRLRLSSTPVPGEALTIPPISEDEAVDFTPSNGHGRWHMQGSEPRMMARQDNRLRNKYSSLAMHASSPESISRMSVLDEKDTRSIVSRLSSADGDDMPLSYRKALIRQHLPNLGSDTRMSSIDSHQPQRPSSSDPDTREALLSYWRDSLRQDGIVQTSSKEYVEVRRAEMLLDRHAKRLGKQQQEQARQYRETLFDQAMRRDDMQGLHREAMRKMQGRAYKHF